MQDIFPCGEALSQCGINTLKDLITGWVHEINGQTKNADIQDCDQN